MEARTIDRVEIGNESSEQKHQFQGDRTNSGSAPWPYAKWRDATGWFAYDLQLPPAPPVALRCVFWGGDVHRTFDVLVEGKVIRTVTLNAPRPGDYVVQTFAIPPALTTGRRQVTVRFQAHEGSLAGGLFDLRTVRPVPTL